MSGRRDLDLEVKSNVPLIEKPCLCKCAIVRCLSMESSADGWRACLVPVLQALSKNICCSHLRRKETYAALTIPEIVYIFPSL